MHTVSLASSLRPPFALSQSDSHFTVSPATEKQRETENERLEKSSLALVNSFTQLASLFLSLLEQSCFISASLVLPFFAPLFRFTGLSGVR